MNVISYITSKPQTDPCNNNTRELLGSLNNLLLELLYVYVLRTTVEISRAFLNLSHTSEICEYTPSWDQNRVFQIEIDQIKVTLVQIRDI